MVRRRGITVLPQQRGFASELGDILGSLSGEAALGYAQGIQRNKMADSLQNLYGLTQEQSTDIMQLPDQLRNEYLKELQDRQYSKTLAESYGLSDNQYPNIADLKPSDVAKIGQYEFKNQKESRKAQEQLRKQQEEETKQLEKANKSLVAKIYENAQKAESGFGSVTQPLAARLGIGRNVNLLRREAADNIIKQYGMAVPNLPELINEYIKRGGLPSDEQQMTPKQMQQEPLRMPESNIAISPQVEQRLLQEQQQAPIEQQQSSPIESLLSSLAGAGRVAAGGIQRGIEELGSVPSNIRDFMTSIRETIATPLTDNEQKEVLEGTRKQLQAFGLPQDRVDEAISNLEKSTTKIDLPGKKDIRIATEQFIPEWLTNPQSQLERRLQNAIGEGLSTTVQSIMLGGSKALPTIMKNAGISFGSNAAKWAAKDIYGVSKDGAEKIKLGTSLALNFLSQPSLRKLNSKLYNEARDILPADASVSRNQGIKILREIEKQVEKGNIPITPAITNSLNSFESRIRQNLPVSDIIEFKQYLNDIYDPSMSNNFKKGFSAIRSSIRDTLEEYGKTNKDWWNLWRPAEDLFTARQSSDAVQKFFNKIITKGKAFSPIALVATGLRPERLAVLGVASTVPKIYDTFRLIATSKDARNAYAQMIQGALKENAPMALRGVTRFDRIAKKTNSRKS